MRKDWLTTYKVKSLSHPDGSSYSSYVLAYSFEEAQHIAVERNLGEVVESVEGVTLTRKLAMIKPSGLFKRIKRTTRVVDAHRDIKNLMHMCCFLLNLNEKKGIPIPDVFSDVGLMHQLVHALLMPRVELNYDFYNLQEVLRELEKHHPEIFLTDAEIRELQD